MYYDKEERERMKRESRITKGGDILVGLLCGLAVGAVMFFVTVFTPLFSKDLIINFLGTELDLRPFAAPAIGSLSAISGLCLGIMWSVNHRSK